MIHEYLIYILVKNILIFDMTIGRGQASKYIFHLSKLDMKISIRDLESVLKEHLNDILYIEVGQIQRKLGHIKYSGAAAISEILNRRN